MFHSVGEFCPGAPMFIPLNTVIQFGNDIKAFQLIYNLSLYGILSMLNGFEMSKIDPLRPYSKFCIKRIVL